MIDKRKLILVIEVALSYDKNLAWHSLKQTVLNKLIRDKKIILA